MLPLKVSLVNCRAAGVSDWVPVGSDDELIDNRSGQDFVDWDREFCLPGQLLFDRFDNVMRHERFAIVLPDVAVRIEAGFAAEVTRELATIVVLDKDHSALREDRLISAAWNGTIHLI